MCDRVALERHLPVDERERLISHSQAVIRQGREILNTWDKQPDAHYAAALADALDAYASGLPQNSSVTPTLSPAAHANPTAQHITLLPDWSNPPPPEAARAQGAMPQ